jgi:hypothetical protein
MRCIRVSTSLLGYKMVYGPRAVALSQWRGKSGKRGGGYHYTFTGKSIVASPTLPPCHGINLTPSREEAVSTMQRVVALRDEVGPVVEFVLG